MKKEVQGYLSSIESNSPTTPALMDKSTFFEIISGLF